MFSVSQTKQMYLNKTNPVPQGSSCTVLFVSYATLSVNLVFLCKKLNLICKMVYGYEYGSWLVFLVSLLHYLHNVRVLLLLAGVRKDLLPFCVCYGLTFLQSSEGPSLLRFVIRCWELFCGLECTEDM